MNLQTNKRNYIRRKKYLNECAEQIKGTLEFIAYARGEAINEEHINKIASIHAEGIEAACWSPHTRISSDNYQALMSSKTKELCRIILKQSFPNFDFYQLQKMISQKTSSLTNPPSIEQLPPIPPSIHQPSSESPALTLKSPPIPQPPPLETRSLTPQLTDPLHIEDLPSFENHTFDLHSMEPHSLDYHSLDMPLSSSISEIPRSLTPKFPLPIIPSSAPAHLSSIEAPSFNFDFPSFELFPSNKLFIGKSGSSVKQFFFILKGKDIKSLFSNC